MDSLRTMDESLHKKLILLNYTKSCPARQEREKHQRLNELPNNQYYRKRTPPLKVKRKVQKINIDWLYEELEKSNKNEREKKAFKFRLRNYQIVSRKNCIKRKASRTSNIDNNIHSPQSIWEKIEGTKKHNILADEYEKKQIKVAQNKERISDLSEKINQIQ